MPNINAANKFFGSKLDNLNNKEVLESDEDEVQNLKENL
jgi:hypothetical protein